MGGKDREVRLIESVVHPDIGPVPREIEYFAIWIATVHDAAQIEHLGAVVEFCPEPVLKPLLLRLESSG
jgi:hypothetical protein